MYSKPDYEIVRLFGERTDVMTASYTQNDPDLNSDPDEIEGW